MHNTLTENRPNEKTRAKFQTTTPQKLFAQNITYAGTPFSQYLCTLQPGTGHILIPKFIIWHRRNDLCHSTGYQVENGRVGAIMAEVCRCLNDASLRTEKYLVLLTFFFFVHGLLVATRVVSRCIIYGHSIHTCAHILPVHKQQVEPLALGCEEKTHCHMWTLVSTNIQHGELFSHVRNKNKFSYIYIIFCSVTHLFVA